LTILLLRGPHCERKTWFGWQGGSSMRKSKTPDLDAQDREKTGASSNRSSKDDAQKQDTPSEKSPENRGTASQEDGE